ncbi:hypothetical protein NDU88_005647 [Pleurodeles waltl]|uniref:Reverse transcriptase domain-containing protein n=1 Tax=Pleurodeles waltl TaxID=8319 RepID=A0AAV7SMI9_PLEWA|nr:hypothetical protein NDU88_005647 [Pleurodeles waltl]
MVSLYADNALVYLPQPDLSVVILSNIMTEFGELFGLRLNKKKLALFPLRSHLSGLPPEQAAERRYPLDHGSSTIPRDSGRAGGEQACYVLNMGQVLKALNPTITF